MKVLILILCIFSGSLFAASIRHATQGIVFDTDTQLMWQDTAVSTKSDWEEAIAVCQHSLLGGFTDWRLPNINELLSLIDYSKDDPALKNIAFQSGNLNGNYWSSTSDLDDHLRAWKINFTNGNPLAVIKRSITEQYYVRCVRGG